MKFSIALSVLIFAGAASLRWRDAQRLAVVRENHTKLGAEAATFGITLDPARPAKVIRFTPRERERKNGEAKAAAAAYIAFKKGQPHTAQEKEARRAHAMDPTACLLALDPTQAQLFLDEIRDARDLSDETRKDMIGFALWTLCEKYPQPVLALFTETFDLLKADDYRCRTVVSFSLAKWSEEDPKAAGEWVRKNGEKFPELVTEDTRINMLSGAARHDPKFAFKLIAELGIQNSSSALSEIGGSAKTPDERTALLFALREHLTTLPDEKTRHETTGNLMYTLTDRLAAEGFTAATQWIASANCTPAELENIAGNLGISIKRDEAGPWVNWVGKQLPAGKSEAPIRSIVRRWTENDHQAAGKWLASTPASPTKNTAIRSYAETVSKYDPATATQWAMTLPPGPDRDATLQHIQAHPPAK
jgi:hypothetical protein